MTSPWLLKRGPSGSIDRIAIELCVFGELAVKYPPPAVCQLRGRSISCEAEGATEKGNALPDQWGQHPIQRKAW